MEKVLWGVRGGDEDWQEQILTTDSRRIEEVKKLAAKDGFGRFRVSEFDPKQKPDFTKTINKGGR